MEIQYRFTNGHSSSADCEYILPLLEGIAFGSSSRISSVTAVVHDLPSRRTTTEAPAIFTRPGLPTYRAWTVGGRSQRGPPLSCGPNALYQGPPSINKITTKRANEMGACLPEGHPQGLSQWRAAPHCH